MMKRVLLLVLALIFVGPAFADNGMWLPSEIAKRIGDMQAKGLRLTAVKIFTVSIRLPLRMLRSISTEDAR